MTGRPFRPHPKPAPRSPSRPAFSAPPRAPDRARAEEIAVAALGFLAADPERLDRFLALTGLDHGSIRAAAGSPGFLSAVLDHVTSETDLLVAFAADAGETPETVAGARERLAGPSLWSSA